MKKYLDTLYLKGTERTADDPYHFYDTEWVKTTPDGLVTLIRAFHKNGVRSLQLLGRIDGTRMRSNGLAGSFLLAAGSSFGEDR